MGTVPGLKDNQLDEVKRLIGADIRLQTLRNETPVEESGSKWLTSIAR